MAELTELGKNACAAKYILQKLTTEEKNKALDTAANYLCDRQAEILAANESDLENGRRKRLCEPKARTVFERFQKTNHFVMKAHNEILRFHVLPLATERSRKLRRFSERPQGEGPTTATRVQAFS